LFPSDRWRYLRASRIVLHLPTHARLAWGLWRDRRTPIWLKALLAAALAYVVLPIDLIPDVVPLLGQADDLAVLLLVLDLFVANAPPEVRAEHLRRARNGTAVLDSDLKHVRELLGPRFDQIRAALPELLERYGGLNDRAARAELIARLRPAGMGRHSPENQENASTEAPMEVS
jgi:uncharacterized membrane protein YkvA (DUF1232 family)